LLVSYYRDFIYLKSTGFKAAKQNEFESAPIELATITLCKAKARKRYKSDDVGLICYTFFMFNIYQAKPKPDDTRRPTSPGPKR
jgi:hypothetical protein